MHTIKLHSTITQDDIQNSASLEEAAHTLSAEARGLGWDLVAFHKDIKANELPRNEVGDFVASSMGWSRECLTTWAASEMAAVCPISMRCSVTDTPFAWYPDPERGIWRDHALNGRSVEALELYGTCIAAAVTVPVRRRSGHGYVSWCTLDKSRLAGLCEDGARGWRLAFAGSVVAGGGGSCFFLWVLSFFFFLLLLNNCERLPRRGKPPPFVAALWAFLAAFLAAAAPAVAA